MKLNQRLVIWALFLGPLMFGNSHSFSSSRHVGATISSWSLVTVSLTQGLNQRINCPYPEEGYHKKEPLRVSSPRAARRA